MLVDENNSDFKKVSKDMAEHNMPTSLYLCDKMQCPTCSYPQCKLTTNIFHKKNVEDKYYYTDMIDWLANLSDEIMNLNDIDENLRDEIAEAMLTARNTLIYYVYFYDKEKGAMKNDD